MVVVRRRCGPWESVSTCTERWDLCTPATTGRTRRLQDDIHSTRGFAPLFFRGRFFLWREIALFEAAPRVCRQQLHPVGMLIEIPNECGKEEFELPEPILAKTGNG